MSQVIYDGEPFEVEKISETINLEELIKNKSLNEIISLDLNPKYLVMPKYLPNDFEEDFKKLLHTRNTAETRLKCCSFLFTTLDIMSESFIKKTALKALLKFSKDEYFSIRKLCAVNIAKTTMILPAKYQHKAIDLYQKYMNDKNVLVVQAAYSALGLLSYISDDLDERLIQFAQVLSASDLSQASEYAFYLPAIYRKFQKFRSELFGIFLSLLRNPQSHVRSKAASTLSFFIRNTENPMELISTYQNLLKDTDIVKIEAISHLGCFLEKVPESLQSQFLGTCRRIQTYNLNWRVNLKLAKSLVKIAKNLKVEYWMQELWTVSVALCHDKNEIVRIKSAKALGRIVKDIWNICESWDKIIQKDLEKMINGKYQERQVLAYISGNCSDIVWFRGILKELAEDPVVDVRLVLALMANKNNITWLASRLLKDKSKAVKDLLNKRKDDWENNKIAFDICQENEIQISEFEEIYNGEEWTPMDIY